MTAEELVREWCSLDDDDLREAVEEWVCNDLEVEKETTK